MDAHTLGFSVRVLKPLLTVAWLSRNPLAPAGVLSSAQLLEMLQTGGEPMSAEELQQVLAALTGCGNPEAALPEWLGAGTFMTEVLGFA